VVCGVIGQHPELYGLPEVNLFHTDTVDDFLLETSNAGHRFMRAGVLRVLAELHHGEQNEDTVSEAEAWLIEHADWPLSHVLSHIAELVHPRRCVDKSPANCSAKPMSRLLKAFPRSPFLHISRHPRAVGNSTWKAMQGKRRGMALRPTVIEKRWRDRHEIILRLEERLEPRQMMYMKGDWLIADPDFYLPQICDWLGVSSAPAMIEAMKHPEDSPYACVGPSNAREGNNPGYLKDPHLRIAPPPDLSLEGPLEWVPGGGGFAVQSRELAQLLGYH
jgi:hypothetical protein